MQIYYTSGYLATLLGLSGTAVRHKIGAGEWKASAVTHDGAALFTEARVASIATEYVNRARVSPSRVRTAVTPVTEDSHA